jgi:hypothetical protein
MLITLVSVAACNKKSSSAAAVTPPVVTPPTDDGTDEVTRRCRIPVSYTNASAHETALEALVQARVHLRERPTTMCVAAEGTPLKRFNASLRFEYEDNYGLRWVTFRKRDLVYSNQQSGKFRLIYLDNYGYVELKTTENSAGRFTGVARLANIDSNSSYLDEIEEFLKKIRETCNEFPAKCLNPIFVIDPANNQPPTDAQIIQRAEEAFQGQHGAEPFVLGNVSIDPNDIESTLF